MPKFEKHLFICCNQREPGHPRGCCDPAGQAQLQFLFKQKLALRGFKKRVRANMSGCLDQCEHGPTVVVYPDAVWYGRVGAVRWLTIPTARASETANVARRPTANCTVHPLTAGCTRVRGIV